MVKKKGDKRTPMFAAVDVGDEEAVRQILRDIPTQRDAKNNVRLECCSITCPVHMYPTRMHMLHTTHTS